jgi:DHA1 family bicyclomycin/chloramphenicol resistance-like MFS transporter
VESGTLPLQLIMLGTSMLAFLSVVFVVWREKQTA